MGGRGSGGNRNTSSSPIKIGGSVTQFEKYTSWNEGGKNIRKDFGLESATEKQIDALRMMFKGILENDKAYDADRTPFIVTDIRISRVRTYTQEELAHNKELFGRTMEDKTLSVRVSTEPNTESSYIRLVDQKERFGLLGTGGGFYTYNRNSKRTNIKPFDIAYGTRHGLEL